MSTQSVDYDALAKQYGGVSSPAAGKVDYDALAKQFGATQTETPPSVPLPAEAAPRLPRPGIPKPAFMDPRRMEWTASVPTWGNPDSAPSAALVRTFPTAAALLLGVGLGSCLTGGWKACSYAPRSIDSGRRETSWGPRVRSSWSSPSRLPIATGTPKRFDFREM